MRLLATLEQANRDYGGGALLFLAAVVAMAWLNRRPNDWWESRPREPRPPVVHETPTQARISGLLPWSGPDHEPGQRDDR